MNRVAFIDQVIEVQRDEQTRQPVMFKWNKKTFRIEKIISAWQDWGFGKAAPRKRSWRMRKHRVYYHVLATSGEEFELYFDRTGKYGAGEWVLTRQLV